MSLSCRNTCSFRTHLTGMTEVCEATCDCRSEHQTYANSRFAGSSQSSAFLVSAVQARTVTHILYQPYCLTNRCMDLFWQLTLTQPLTLGVFYLSCISIFWSVSPLFFFPPSPQPSAALTLKPLSQPTDVKKTALWGDFVDAFCYVQRFSWDQTHLPRSKEEMGYFQT